MTKYISSMIKNLGDLAAAINRGPNSLTYSEIPRYKIQLLSLIDQIKPQDITEEYISVLLSSGYYLCDEKEKSLEMIENVIFNNKNDNNCENILVQILIHLLQYEQWGHRFIKLICNNDNQLDWAKGLRKNAYEFGTPCELLLVDIISAIVTKREA